jgi:hypothetical protein
MLRGILILLLIACVVGWVITWLSGASRRLSESGREMEDFWKDDGGTPPDHQA